jgi:hypothetical protein
MTHINFILVGKKSEDLFDAMHGSDKEKIRNIHSIGMDHLTLETNDKNTIYVWLPTRGSLNLRPARNTIIFLCPADEKELKLLADKTSSWNSSTDTRFCVIADEALQSIKLKNANIEFHNYPHHGVSSEYIEEIYSKFFKKPVVPAPTPERKPSFFEKLKKMPTLTRIFSNEAKELGLVSESKASLSP